MSAARKLLTVLHGLPPAATFGDVTISCVERIDDHAPKGPDRPAQGTALGTEAVKGQALTGRHKEQASLALTGLDAHATHHLELRPKPKSCALSVRRAVRRSTPKPPMGGTGQASFALRGLDAHTTRHPGLRPGLESCSPSGQRPARSSTARTACVDERAGRRIMILPASSSIWWAGGD